MQWARVQHRLYLHGAWPGHWTRGAGTVGGGGSRWQCNTPSLTPPPSLHTAFNGPTFFTSPLSLLPRPRPAGPAPPSPPPGPRPDPAAAPGPASFQKLRAGSPPPTPAYRQLLLPLHQLGQLPPSVGDLRCLRLVVHRHRGAAPARARAPAPPGRAARSVRPSVPARSPARPPAARGTRGGDSSAARSMGGLTAHTGGRRSAARSADDALPVDMDMDELGATLTSPTKSKGLTCSTHRNVTSPF